MEIGHTFYSWSTFIVMEAGFLHYVFCLNFMVYIQDPFYYFSANKKYPLFSILHQELKLDLKTDKLIQSLVSDHCNMFLIETF